MQRNVLTIFSLYDVNVLFVKSGVKERERILPEVKIILNNVRETLQDKYKNQKSKKKGKKIEGDKRTKHGQAQAQVYHRKTVSVSLLTLSKALFATLDNSPATSSVTVKQGFLSFSICFFATTSKARSGVKSPSLIPNKMFNKRQVKLIIMTVSCTSKACPLH